MPQPPVQFASDLSATAHDVEDSSIPWLIEMPSEYVATSSPDKSAEDRRPAGDCIVVQRFQVQQIQQILASQQVLLQKFEKQRAMLERSHNELLGKQYDFPASPSLQPETPGRECAVLAPASVTKHGESQQNLGTDSHPAEAACSESVVLGKSNILCEQDSVANREQANDDGKLRVQEPLTGEESCLTREELDIRNSKLMEFAIAKRDSEKAAADQLALLHASPLWKRMVRSHKFDLVVGVVILINTFMMLVSLELNGWKLKKDLFDNCDSCGDLWDGFKPVAVGAEHCFTIIFLLELCIRLAADGRKYLQSKLNLFDMSIVITSVVDLWVLDPLGGVDGVSSMKVLRLARFAKLGKVFRVVRVLKAFEPLRVLVTTIAQSVESLAWSMTLLFVCELIGSIFLTQMLQSFLTDDSNNLDMRKTVWERFGTWSKSMFTAYEITMAPGGFIQYREIVEATNPLVGAFLIVYGCVVTFAVIRVITALFLKETLSVCDKEERARQYRTAASFRQIAQELNTLVDEDGSGGISYDEFLAAWEIPQMQYWCTSVGLTLNGAKRLFFCLSDNATLEMNFLEFLDALSGMRGHVRIADHVVMSYESRKLLDLVTYLVALMTEQFGTAENFHRIQYEHLRLDAMTF